jgi:guanylate kinase
MNPKGRPFVVSAPSGSGKTTLCRKLTSLIDRLDYSVSYTTRLPRNNEVEGEDYFFVSKDRFEEMVDQGSFAEWALVYGNYYGTSKDFMDKSLESGHDLLLDVDTVGALKIKRLYPEAILIFVLPPSLAELKRRLEGRAQDDEEVVRKRIREAKRELDAVSSYDYMVVNDTLEDALLRLHAIIVAERCRLSRNRHLIEELLRETLPSL